MDKIFEEATEVQELKITSQGVVITDEQGIRMILPNKILLQLPDGEIITIDEILAAFV